MNPDKIAFNGTDYTIALLNSADTDELLALRNQIADNLGVPHVRKFSDHDTAVKQTVKALERFQKTVDEEAGVAGDSPAPKAKKAPKEKGPYQIPKSASAGQLKRPARKHFDSIEITGEHDGTQGRADRWKNYKTGMLVADVIEGEGTEAWDLKNWGPEGFGLLKIVPCTDDEYTARRAAWYKKHGLADPDVVKAEKAAEREKAKAEREAAAEAKKAEREAAKAEKAKEREEAKAAREKAKADKEAAKAAAAAKTEA